jgi:AcrR family transcriptional regulator
VAESPPHAETAALGLPRLPPGRHGLPREFVVKNQRDRLTAGTIAAVCEHGYHDTTISQIAAAAGVSRRTFYVHFESKQECFLATFDEIAAHLRLAAEEAAGEVGGSDADWGRRVAAKLAAALAVFAANPQLARFTLAVPPRAGGEVMGRYRAALERALTELTEGMPAAVAAQAPSPAVQQSLIGGIVALIAGRIEAGEGEQVGELLPELTELFLAPFVGRAEAVLVATAA